MLGTGDHRTLENYVYGVKLTAWLCDRFKLARTVVTTERTYTENAQTSQVSRPC